jgi:4-hydroxy-3-polyprenylbenzoate decarboxylase
MKQSYRGQAKQAANAIWGSSAAHVRYKHVTVVDDDIDIHDYAAVDWAVAYRVNAGENDIVIMPATFGAGLDPSTRRRDRNADLFGTGKWNRVLIRRHHQPRLRPRPGPRRAALPAHRLARARGPRGRDEAVGRVGAGEEEIVRA